MPETPLTIHHSPLTSAQPLIRFDRVSKSFGSLRVLRELSLDFEEGKTTVVLGPSGTGKSVLLKHIVGLLRPDAGSVYFGPDRVDTLGEADLVPLRRRVGFLFQMGALFDSMTVGENVAFPLTEHTKMSRSEQDDRGEHLLTMVGLPGIQHKMPAELSGGQRKRVALARAIALEPELLLYDEPTTGLDPITADVINELIIAMRDKLELTNLVVTHDMQSANKIADRLVLLYDGSIVADGTPEHFRDHDSDRVQRFVQGRADEKDLRAIRDGFEEEAGFVEEMAQHRKEHRETGG